MKRIELDKFGLLFGGWHICLSAVCKPQLTVADNRQLEDLYHIIYPKDDIAIKDWQRKNCPDYKRITKPLRDEIKGVLYKYPTSKEVFIKEVITSFIPYNKLFHKDELNREEYIQIRNFIQRRELMKSENPSIVLTYMDEMIESRRFAHELEADHYKEYKAYIPHNCLLGLKLLLDNFMEDLSQICLLHNIDLKTIQKNALNHYEGSSIPHYWKPELLNENNYRQINTDFDENSISSESMHFIAGEHYESKREAGESDYVEVINEWQGTEQNARREDRDTFDYDPQKAERIFSFCVDSDVFSEDIKLHDFLVCVSAADFSEIKKKIKRITRFRYIVRILHEAMGKNQSWYRKSAKSIGTTPSRCTGNIDERWQKEANALK
ncbi:hypothetical protein [Parabacteroides sp. PF5-6]|uniref:hypothetical protein n=1 Tax=Parabacteroides sp. PF5-6 TaxID=1742403 RepID=UPI002406C007|nr:hypothetical protein [Parabacteroides sp. PF5-6]MDF9829336.1 hypothetical protein [Parabacteroides sp. PF5-6]